MRIFVIIIILLTSFGNLFSKNDNFLNYNTPIRVTENKDIETKIIYKDGAIVSNGKLVCFADSSIDTYEFQNLYKLEEQGNFMISGATLSYVTSFLLIRFSNSWEEGHSNFKSHQEVAAISILPGLIGGFLGYISKDWEEVDIDWYEINPNIENSNSKIVAESLVKVEIINNNIRIKTKQNSDFIVLDGCFIGQEKISPLSNNPPKDSILSFDDIIKIEEESNYSIYGFSIAYTGSFLFYNSITNQNNASLGERLTMSFIPALLGSIIGYNIPKWEEIDLYDYKKTNVSMSLLPVYNPSINFTGLNLSISF